MDFKYTLDTTEYRALYTGYTDIFKTAYHLRDVSMKNAIAKALELHSPILLHIVIPKKGVVPGWFITTTDGVYISHRSRINYMHERKVKYACYKHCNVFNYFFT